MCRSALRGTVWAGGCEDEMCKCVAHIMSSLVLIWLAFVSQDQVTYLDALTGRPHDDDLLLFALPVAAPYRQACTAQAIASRPSWQCDSQARSFFFLPTCSHFIPVP